MSALRTVQPHKSFKTTRNSVTRNLIPRWPCLRRPGLSCCSDPRLKIHKWVCYTFRRTLSWVKWTSFFLRLTSHFRIFFRFILVTRALSSEVRIILLTVALMLTHCTDRLSAQTSRNQSKLPATTNTWENKTSMRTIAGFASDPIPAFQKVLLECSLTNTVSGGDCNCNSALSFILFWPDPDFVHS